MDNYIEDIIKRNGFINGIYTPWFHKDWFGFDIGKSVYDGYNKCFFDEAYIESVFYNCKAIGFDMAKIWMNESFEGMLFDEKGSVIGVEPVFMQNFSKLLQIVKKLDFKLSICLNAHQEMYYPENKPLYDRYMRFVYLEEETEKYIENWVNPILRTAAEYGCVPLIDVYAEPEADGGGWNLSRGFSWKSMTRFINRVMKAVKDADPKFATTVSSGAGCETLKQGWYNDINADYLGADIYSDGDFLEPQNMFLTKPFMLGEYGIGSYKTASDSNQVRIVERYLKNCFENNVAAAFYWCYGWKCKKADEMHLVDSNGELRPAAAYIHYMQLDRRNKNQTENIDKPVLLALTEPGNVKWFGTRGADYYYVEREVNGEFTVISKVYPENSDYDFPLILKYDDSKAAGTCYRITAVMANGERSVSAPANLIKRGDNV